jgi:hypothetical protein
MARKKKTQQQEYGPYFSKFMAWRIGQPEDYYTANVRFPRRELLQITADEVAGYLCYKAYGKRDPGPNDNPNKCRSSSLLQYKKAISYFMPTQEAWNVARILETLQRQKWSTRSSKM